ncbi:ABC transporter substrate-binding protein [Halorubrum pallidum]
MEPVGEVAFRAVPERWLTYFPGYADMGVALGHGDGLVAVGNVPRYHVDAYDELPGVSVDTEGLTEVLGEGGIDTEIYYELDADVHLTDPQWLINNSAFGLEADAVDEVATNVAPFLGNTVFRRTDAWHDYRYYTLYEAFETVAEVFKERERYEAFRAFHDDVIAAIHADLPPADRRPNALLTFGDGDEPERFSPYRLSDRGTNKKQFRDLGIADALADTGISGLSTTDRGRIDYETMLEVDPDVILVRGHEDKTADEFADTVLAFMRDHEVASELTAVQNDRVFRGGPIYQGPIQHLFSLERAATEIFPDTFSGELFDRDELAAIVAGES